MRDRQLFEQYLDLLSTDEVRSQNLAFAFRSALRNRDHGPLAWDRVERTWEKLLERLPSNSVNRCVEGIVTIHDPDVAARVTAFLADHPVPQAAKHIDQAIERMQVTVALRRREADRIVAELP